MGVRICNIVLESVSLLVLTVAFLLTLTALSTTEWQVANLRQMGQILHEGLWQDCVYGSRGTDADGKDWLCTLKIYGQDSQTNGFAARIGMGRQKPEGK